MARLQILEYPDPRLRTRAEPVTVFDEALARFAADMLETMYASGGIGLAAVQVGVHHRALCQRGRGFGQTQCVLQTL